MDEICAALLAAAAVQNSFVPLFPFRFAKQIDDAAALTQRQQTRGIDMNLGLSIEKRADEWNEAQTFNCVFTITKHAMNIPLQQMNVKYNFCLNRSDDNEKCRLSGVAVAFVFGIRCGA